MGIFGIGKKKKKVNEVDEAFKQFGAVTNEIKDNEQISRKDAVAEMKQAEISATKRENVINGLASLRKVLYINPDLSDFCDKIMDIVDIIKRSPDNEDKEVMGAIDNFILNAIHDGISYANKNSYIGVNTCITFLHKLATDRMQGAPYYKDPEYCRRKLEANRIDIVVKNLEAQHAMLKENGKELLAKAKDPRLSSQQASFARELDKIKAEMNKITQDITTFSDRRDIYLEGVRQLEAKIQSHVNDNVINLEDSFDAILETKYENESEINSMEKMKEQLGRSHIKYSDATLSIDSDMMDSKSKEVDLSQYDEFNF